MCSNIRLSKSKNVVSGHKAPFITHWGINPTEGIFGLNKGLQYNCRSERINFRDTTWYGQRFKRGLVPMIGFFEGNQNFEVQDGKEFYAACLYNDKNEFIIITEPSTGVVAMYHSRMPMFISSEVTSLVTWLNEGRIRHLNPQLIRRA